MGKMNMGRVVMGGLLAGVVLNVVDLVVHGVLLMDDYQAALQALGKPEMPTIMIGWFVLLDFVAGILLIWFYAAIRPRFGPGPKTAILAGVVGWFLVVVLPALYQGPMNVMPMNLLVIGTIVGLVEVPAAAVAGAWLYREEG